MSRLHVMIPTEFLRLVDEYAHTAMMTRSSYVRLALQEKMGVNSVVVNPKKDPDEEWQEFMDKLYGPK